MVNSYLYRDRSSHRIREPSDVPLESIRCALMIWYFKESGILVASLNALCYLSVLITGLGAYDWPDK